MPDLLPFQRRFLSGATRPGIRTAALSLPRGNGKSWLASHLLARILDPADSWFRPGTESVLCAASIEQARIVFRFVRAALEDRGGYRFIDSATRCAVLHKATNTRLRVVGSNGKTAMGLVNCPWAVCDEPGAWETNGGTLLHDAIETAQGKPESPLRALYIGTLAPSTSGWWHDMIRNGSHDSVYVQSLHGAPAWWDQWPEIRRCNPLMSRFPESRKVLLEERDAARRDTRLKARFLSYRLNVPTADESTVLLTVDDWKGVLARPVARRAGRPIVGLDLGENRAWSAAVALWPTGRIEALALAPGKPSLAEQEKRDRVPRGTYEALLKGGALRIAGGLRVPPPHMTLDAIRDAWGRPELIISDYFRHGEVQDCAPGIPVKTRRTRWSESSEDIRALRRLAMDGPLSCAEPARALLAAALAVSRVKDDEGSVRLVKMGTNNTARDDAAQALVFAAGELGRRQRQPPPRPWRYAVVKAAA